MRHISASSVNEALYNGLYHLHHFSYEESSRNGPVFVSRQPVVTTFHNPRHRVLINAKRDPNPFFHLFEALWMLAGRNDLSFPKLFVSTFGQFSDDGTTLHGAYGYRWRNWFGYDQLNAIIGELKNNPKTRRCVLAMWDGGAAWDTGDELISGRDALHDDMQGDLWRAINGGKDVPCNTHAYFDTVGGKLNLTTVARGLDIVLGAYGANAVHMSILLEYVAAMTGLEMGVYRQFANNFHAYQELYPRLKLDSAGLADLANDVLRTDPYYQLGGAGMKLALDAPNIVPIPLMEPGEQVAWHSDLEMFMAMVDTGNSRNEYQTRFYRLVVAPMYAAWHAWKHKDYESAQIQARHIIADDWRLAAESWLAIRAAHRKEAE